MLQDHWKPVLCHLLFSVLLILCYACSWVWVTLLLEFELVCSDLSLVEKARSLLGQACVFDDLLAANVSHVLASNPLRDPCDAAIDRYVDSELSLALH